MLVQLRLIRLAGDRNDHPVFLHHTIRVRQRIGSSCIEHDVNVLNDVFEFRLRVIDRLIRAELFKQILVWGGGGGNDFRATRLGNLYGKMTDTARAAVD